MQKDIFKNKPFLIAEISANHCGNLSLAKKLIDTAKNNGADLVGSDDLIETISKSHFSTCRSGIG